MVKNKVKGFREEVLDTNEVTKNQESGEDSSNNEMECETGDETDNNKTEESSINPVKMAKKKKKGIIYVSNIPKHMNVTRIREILGQYGDIGRVYLQPETLTDNEKKKKKKRKRFARHFTEGWVEFEKKRVAKQVAEMLNNTQIGSRKRSQFYDCLWSMKYLPRFKWIHLSERINYEKAVHKQKLMTEVSQARKEATFFQSNLDKSEMLQKISKRESNKQSNT